MTITESDLTAARKAWGDALISISAAFELDGIDAASAVAGDALDTAYGYNLGSVLFNPTLASGEQTFRTTREGALAYFVGHSDKYPLDGGFGIKGWKKVEYTTAASFIDGDVAMWMGWVTFTDKDGGVLTVDKSWGYQLDDARALRIVLHHSSLRYVPD